MEAAAYLASTASLPEAFWKKLLHAKDDISNVQYHMLRTHMVNYATMLAFTRGEESACLPFSHSPPNLGDLDEMRELEGHVLLHGIRHLSSAGSLLVDWREAKKRYRSVHKFQPGKHFHAVHERFNTLDAAKAHLAEKGYIYDGLEITHYYTREGD